jgi:type I restriction enzyme, S subunit
VLKGNSWRSAKLGDLFTIKHGYAFKGEYFGSEGSHIVLTPGNFFDEGGFKKKGDKEKWYSGNIQEEYILSQGDLLVAMTEQAEGLLGSAALVPENSRYLHNQRLGLVRNFNCVEKRFLYFLFNSQPVRQQIRASCSGVKVRHTSPSRIYEVKVDIPPLPTQRKIAAILSAYDDLIENNLRRIKILEEMAQNIYNEWFVKFRFPGHQHARFTDFPLGRIPEEWEVKKISDVAVVHRGRSYKGTELSDEGGRPFVNLKCMERDGGFRSSGLKRYIGSFKDTQTVRAGEMVMAITDMTQERRIIARVGRVSRLDADFGVISMDLVRVASRDNLSETYLYGMFRWSGFADEVKQHANGANVLHLLPDRIVEYRFVCPTPDIAARFGEIVLPMLSLCDSFEQKNTTLRRTRDLLLSRLISSEVDVSALDIAVPEEASV